MNLYNHPRSPSDREHLSTLLKGEFLTTGQTARALHLTRERVRQLSVDGELPSIDTPLGRLFARIDVVRYAEKNAHQSRRAEGAS